MSKKRKAPGILRTDFPIGRLFGKILMGNAICIGVVNLLFVAASMYDELFHWGYYGRENAFLEMCNEGVSANQAFIERILFDHLYLGCAVLMGTLLSMIWYVVARRIETRSLKKRWLVIQKSREQSETLPL